MRNCKSKLNIVSDDVAVCPIQKGGKSWTGPRNGTLFNFSRLQRWAPYVDLKLTI
jgi:hypothetical protein